MKYHQCKLTNGTTHTVGYIEERGAIVGAKVELEEHDELWEVLTVSTNFYTKNELRAKQRADRNSCSSIK